MPLKHGDIIAPANVIQLKFVSNVFLLSSRIVKLAFSARDSEECEGST